MEKIYLMLMVLVGVTTCIMAIRLVSEVMDLIGRFTNKLDGEDVEVEYSEETNEEVEFQRMWDIVAFQERMQRLKDENGLYDDVPQEVIDRERGKLSGVEIGD